MAGVKGRSGRKSNAEIEACRALIDGAVTPARWKKVFLNLANIAEKDDGRAAVLAAELLMRYRFGIPTQVIGGDPELPPIRITQIVAE